MRTKNHHFLKRGLISNGNDNDKENKYKYFH